MYTIKELIEMETSVGLMNADGDIIACCPLMMKGMRGMDEL